FTRAARRDEIFKYIKTFTEVRLDRHFHRLTVGREHQSAYARELTHLYDITARARVAHHLDRIVAVELALQCLDNISGGFFPNLDDRLITFVFRKTSALEVLHYIEHLLFSRRDYLVFFWRYRHVGYRN